MALSKHGAIGNVGTSFSPAELVGRGVVNFADLLRAASTADHPYVQAAINSYLAVFLAGGKRARGGLTVCGYEMHGGSNRDMISDVAGAIEGIHAYILVLDDIADNAMTRRGVPAAHVAMQTFLEQQDAEGNRARIATDMATSAALFAQHRAQEMFMDLDVPEPNKAQACQALNRHLARTHAGQILDIASTTGLPMSTDNLITVARSKTAYYSFLMPLEIGALLAGTSPRLVRYLDEYSMHAGLAFQLQDDAMLFEEEAAIGKSPENDITEGKQTLLLAYAQAAATDAQREILNRALGNPELTTQDFELCKEVMRATGALARVQRQAAEEVKLAHALLDNAPVEWPAVYVAYLRDMASFTMNKYN